MLWRCGASPLCSVLRGLCSEPDLEYDNTVAIAIVQSYNRILVYSDRPESGDFRADAQVNHGLASGYWKLQTAFVQLLNVYLSNGSASATRNALCTLATTLAILRHSEC